MSTSFGSIKRQSLNVQDPNWANNSNNITPTRARLPAPLVANHHGTITGPHASGIPELNTRSIEMIGERASDGRLGLANEAGLRRINGSSPLIFSLSLSLRSPLLIQFINTPGPHPLAPRPTLDGARRVHYLYISRLR